MVIPAKLALPFPSHTVLIQPAVERAFGGTALFSAPAGYLHTDRLSALVQEMKTPVLWLRADSRDSDPAALYISLATGIYQFFPEISRKALNGMRLQPGPLYGWGQLFSGLARDLSDALGTLPSTSTQNSPFTLVIEHIDQLNSAPSTQALLWEHFLPLLPIGSTRILTCHTPPSRASIPAYVQVSGSNELRLDEHACLALAHEIGVRLPPNRLIQMVRLAEGREVVLTLLISACHIYGTEGIIRALAAANNLKDLLVRLARGLIDMNPTGTEDLLALALRLEHLQPELVQAALSAFPGPPVLFFQSLDRNNVRLRCIWQEPLRAVIRPGETQGREALLRAARFIASQADDEQAVPLLLDLGEHDQAAEVINRVIEPLMDRGQWETLSSWLKRLPKTVRHSWPWLVYAEGELVAAQGQAQTARKTFAMAARLFEKRKDYKGICQSLLTESCLAAWQKDLTRAQECALHARSIAQAGGLDWYLAWANWQIGSLAASAGLLSEAIDSFDLAEKTAETTADVQANAQMAEFINNARHLAQVQIEQHNKKNQYIQAYYEADQAEREAANRLRFLLESPTTQAGDPREPYSWTRNALLLKPPSESSSNNGMRTEKLINRLRGILHSISDASEVAPGNLPDVPIEKEKVGNKGAKSELLQITVTAPNELSWDAPGSAADALPNSADIKPTLVAHPIIEARKYSTGSPIETDIPDSIPQNDPISEEILSSPHIQAYLLGNFRVIIHEKNLETLPSGRGRIVFTYLLLQRGHPVPRDVIMDTFWPEASAEAARNSLNVAVYSLRQALKTVVDIPIILFQENSYLLNPVLVPWLDVAEFESHVMDGRANESNGKHTAATQAYEKALSLYQGDLLSDYPYEDWVILERERLRVLFLETLDRLSLIYFNQGQYGACVALCQQILAQDICREDAHCRLMRCYSRQNQNHLALRQFQACVEALRRDLDVDPAPSTLQLYEKIRRRELI